MNFKLFFASQYFSLQISKVMLSLLSRAQVIFLYYVDAANLSHNKVSEC